MSAGTDSLGPEGHTQLVEMGNIHYQLNLGYKYGVHVALTLILYPRDASPHL